MKNKYAQKIVPFLWFDKNAEIPVKHYLSIFKNSRIVEILRCGEAGPGPKGSILAITFELEGQKFMALNGGSEDKFSRAFSLLVKTAENACASLRAGLALRYAAALASNSS